MDWWKLLESAVFGNILNIVGIVLTLIGFGITIAAFFKLRETSQVVRDEVLKIRRDLYKVNTVADFTHALNLIDDIKRIHREDQSRWSVLPDRYSTLKSLIISINTTYTGFSPKQKTSLQDTLTSLTTIESQIDVFLMGKVGKRGPPDMSKLNHQLTTHSDQLREILIFIRNDIGG